MDHGLISQLLDEMEDEDSTAIGKKGLASLKPAEAEPAAPAEPEKPAGGDKLAELVASLSPEEKAKLRALLDDDDGDGGGDGE